MRELPCAAAARGRECPRQRDTCELARSDPTTRAAVEASRRWRWRPRCRSTAAAGVEHGGAAAGACSTRSSARSGATRVAFAQTVRPGTTRRDSAMGFCLFNRVASERRRWRAGRVRGLRLWTSPRQRHHHISTTPRRTCIRVDPSGDPYPAGTCSKGGRAGAGPNLNILPALTAGYASARVRRGDRPTRSFAPYWLLIAPASSPRADPLARPGRAHGGDLPTDPPVDGVIPPGGLRRVEGGYDLTDTISAEPAHTRTLLGCTYRPEPASSATRAWRREPLQASRLGGLR